MALLEARPMTSGSRWPPVLAAESGSIAVRQRPAGLDQAVGARAAPGENPRAARPNPQSDGSASSPYLPAPPRMTHSSHLSRGCPSLPGPTSDIRNVGKNVLSVRKEPDESARPCRDLLRSAGLQRGRRAPALSCRLDRSYRAAT